MASNPTPGQVYLLTAKGCIKHKRCLNDEKENSGIGYNELPQHIFAIQHSMTNTAASYSNSDVQ